MPDNAKCLMSVPFEYMGVEAVPTDTGGKPGPGQRLALRPVTDRYPVDFNRYTLVMDKPLPGEPPVVHKDLHQQHYVLYEGNRTARTMWSLTPQEALEEAVDYILIPRTDDLLPHILATYVIQDPEGKGMSTKKVRLVLVPQLGLTKRQLLMVKDHGKGRTLFNSNFSFANTTLGKQELIKKLPGTRDVFTATDLGREKHRNGDPLKRYPAALPTELVEVITPLEDGKSILEYFVKQFGAYCQGCGEGPFRQLGSLQLVHKMPVVEGGEEHISNLAPLCQPCNKRKGDDYTLTGLRKRNMFHGLMVDERVLKNWRALRPQGSSS